MEEEEALRNYHERERKAVAAKENVKKASHLAESLLGQPLSYEVVNACPIYNEPVPGASTEGVVTKGSTVYGFPGSVAWIRMHCKDDDDMAPPSGPQGQRRDRWVPVRSQEARVSRELVLRSMWAELRATKTMQESIEVTWLGIPPPPYPNRAEYVLEWRLQDEISDAAVRRISCLEAHGCVSNLSAETDVQLRVALRISGRDSRDLRLVGPWQSFCTGAKQTRFITGPLVQETFEIPVPDGKEQLFEVVHDCVVLRRAPSREASHKGVAKRGHLLMGVCREIRHGSKREPWLQLSQKQPPSAPEAIADNGDGCWALIDASGSDPDLGVLLRPVDAGASLSRSAAQALALASPLGPSGNSATIGAPPRPLTAAWLAEHGGALKAAVHVNEEALPDEEDVGMASQCSILRVAAPGITGKTTFIAKRAPEWGDIAGTLREHHFYVEGPGKGLLPAASKLIRLPQCLVSTWPGPGQEVKRDALLLVLERLGAPQWIRVLPEEGCSVKEAGMAVEALGTMHRAYAEASALEQLEWLPRGIFDITKSSFVQPMYTMAAYTAMATLADVMPEPVRKVAEKMAWGGLTTILDRLADPPLTLVHGDFRPENLRFSADSSQVAAFDWGLAHRGRGVWDFAYFVIMSQPPEQRRANDDYLTRKYLSAVGLEGSQSDTLVWKADLKLAALGILALAMMTHSGVHTGKDKLLLRRMLSWASEAIVDWNASDALPG